MIENKEFSVSSSDDVKKMNFEDGRNKKAAWYELWKKF
jgi:hypothetical protein